MKKLNLLACPECGATPKLTMDKLFGDFDMFTYLCCSTTGTSCTRMVDALNSWNYNENVVDDELRRLRATIKLQADQLVTANKALRVFKRMTEKGYLR